MRCAQLKRLNRSDTDTIIDLDGTLFTELLSL